MYNLAVLGDSIAPDKVKEVFGEKYDLTEDLSQANVLAACDGGNPETPDSKLLFAVCDMTENGLSEDAVTFCMDRGICVFNDNVVVSGSAINSTRYFIEQGNITGSDFFPDIDLGPFGDDVSRVVIMMKGIDDPILLAAMMFSGMDVRAVSGGLARRISKTTTYSPESIASGADISEKKNSSGADSSEKKNSSGADTSEQKNSSGADASEKKNSSGAAVIDESLYGCALVALREPVTRIPHIDGVIKVRVLQDI